MTAPDLAVFRNLVGTTCVCGAVKKAQHSFCRAHYFQLPHGTRLALYETDGYADTFRRACDLLGLNPPGSSSKSARAASFDDFKTTADCTIRG